MTIIWVVAAALGMFGLLVLLARFLHFQENAPAGTPVREVRVSRIDRQQEIVVKGPDGQEHRFASVEEMPPEMRAVVEDAAHTRQVRGRIILNVDGMRHEYDSLDEAPPEIRERIRALQDAPSEHGIMVEINGEKHCYAKEEDVPPHLRRFLGTN